MNDYSGYLAWLWAHGLCDNGCLGLAGSRDCGLGAHRQSGSRVLGLAGSGDLGFGLTICFENL